MTPEIRAALLRARAEQQPVVLATCLASGAQRLLPNDSAPAALNAAAIRALAADTSTTAVVDDDRWFLHVHNLPLRLFLIGAVHIAQSVVRLAPRSGDGRALPRRHPDAGLARRGAGPGGAR